MDDISAGVIGWLGTVGTFGAYALLWRGRVGPASRVYAALNVLGGLLGAVAGVLYGAWPSVASNAVWAAVGLHTLIVVSRRQSEATVVVDDRVPAEVMGEETGAIALPTTASAVDTPPPVPASSAAGLPPFVVALTTSSIPRIAG